MKIKRLGFLIVSVVISCSTTAVLGNSFQASDVIGAAIQESQNDNAVTLHDPLQGTSPADLQITAKIQKDLLDTDGLSVDARAVKVTTLNGRVTLRGIVAATEEKRLLGQIAARTVPAANVNNQLQVKETASA
jgi:osmotically-inducible protein OsmY